MTPEGSPPGGSAPVRPSATGPPAPASLPAFSASFQVVQAPEPSLFPAAFAVGLGGLLILIEGAVEAALLTNLSGLGSALPLLAGGAASAGAILLGAGLVVVALALWNVPENVTPFGVAAVLAGVLSLAVGGGFLVGLGLSVAGGFLALSVDTRPRFELQPAGTVASECPKCGAATASLSPEGDLVCEDCGNRSRFLPLGLGRWN